MPTQNGQTDPRTPCRSLLCRKSPLSRVGTSRQSRKSLQFAPLPSSSGESRLMRLTRSIPMVVPGASDPVGVGWAQSLARPGGNVTGFTDFELSTLGKSLEILKQIAPAVVRVAYFAGIPMKESARRLAENRV